MKGRQENIKKTEEKLNEIVKAHSDILTQYYYYLDDKTHNTKRMYVYRVKKYLDFLRENKFDIEDISTYQKMETQDIKYYMKETKYNIRDGEAAELSASYRTLQLSAIRSFYEFLIEEYKLENNPCLRVKLPKVKEDKDIVYLTPDEVAIIKNNIKNGVGNSRAKAKQEHWYERDMCLIHILLHTGLRVTALTEIDVDDIDFENNIIRVTEKENFTRDIDINLDTVKYLKAWLEKRKELLEGWPDVNALFISNNRTRINPNTVNKMVKKYCYNIDKKITPHKFRSTFATTVYSATQDIYITSDLIGHANIETTKKYAAINKEKRKAVINLLSDIY